MMNRALGLQIIYFKDSDKESLPLVVKNRLTFTLPEKTINIYAK